MATSTSSPTGWFVFSSRNSIGAYAMSEPMSSEPSFSSSTPETSTLAALADVAVPAAFVAAEVPAGLAPAVAVLSALLVPPPQAAAAKSAAPASANSASFHLRGA